MISRLRSSANGPARTPYRRGSRLAPTMPIRSLAVLPLALVAACSFQRFAASKVVDYALPVAGVQRLSCQSHNGGITVIGDAAATEIVVHAEITARAGSQVEADALLHQLDVRRDVADGGLTVTGTGPQTGWTESSVFTFTITLPPQTALDLLSHNGELRLQGTAGDVRVETHNGGITGDTAGSRLVAVTHNGNVRLTLRCAAREATIETHNGEVEVELAATQDARLEAATHNGRIRCDPPLEDATRGRNRLVGRLGDGKGSLRITTHNGDVVLR